MKKKNTLILAGLLCVMGALSTSATWAVTPKSPPAWGERWKKLPRTPAPVAALKPAYASVNGIQLYYATTGEGKPVVLLHGGLANSDYWGLQVAALAKDHKVIVVDSRGHGRSTRDERPYSYDLMSDDVVALLDHLNIQKADIVGWSDGGIIGIDLAIRHPTRVNRIFSFAPNTKTSGVKPDTEKNPVFASYIERAGNEYRKLSKTPDQYDAFVDQISHMWATQPNWSDEDLKKISNRVLIVDGDHDEAIVREHLEYIANTIPKAGLLILPNTSHFAFIQAPKEFNEAILNFIDYN